MGVHACGRGCRGRGRGRGERSPAQAAPCSKCERHSERGEKVRTPRRGQRGARKEVGPAAHPAWTFGLAQQCPPCPPGWAHTLSLLAPCRDLWALPTAPNVTGFSQPATPAAPLPHGRLPSLPLELSSGRGSIEPWRQGQGRGLGVAVEECRVQGLKGAPGAEGLCGQLPAPSGFRKRSQAEADRHQGSLDREEEEERP